ncbi:Cyp4v2 [Acrasis kona]|uniref:Cyp4v2 n=1 Tax=Acrasis kona TaxID=1008807 RepID=A0AAW2YUE5_9EUKA
MKAFSSRPSFNVPQPELAKKVLLNWRVFRKIEPTITPDLHKLSGLNVVFANGDEWKAQRQVMNPAFYNVDQFATEFTQRTIQCLQTIEELQKTRTTIQVPPLMTALTLDILGTTIFGYDFNCMNEIATPNKHSESAAIVHAYEYVLKNIVTFTKLILQHNYPTFFKKQADEFDSNLKVLDDLAKRMIHKSKEKLSNGGQAETLLDMMVTASESEHVKMNDKTLRDNMLVLLIAGHDTTSNALSYALYSLCKHPDIQVKLYNEIINKVGLNGEVTIEKIDQIEYLDWFIKENLRLHSPVSSIPPKILSEDFVLGDYKLKKGVIVTINSFAIHRNPDVWGGDAEEFRPERFSPEESKKRHSNAFMPFSSGPRTCMGNRFSLLEQKIFLVSLLRKFELAMPSRDFVCKPQKGDVMFFASKDLHLTFTSRH